jgi:hypothetical protein
MCNEPAGVIYWQVSGLFEQFDVVPVPHTLSHYRRRKCEGKLRSDLRICASSRSDFCSGPYDPLKVDVWSAGATVWEMAQTQPPFADYTDARKIGNRWPPLSYPELYSRPFQEFLFLSSQPASTRPCPSELLTASILPADRLLFVLTIYISRILLYRMHADARSSFNCYHNVELSSKGCWRKLPLPKDP